MKKPVIDRRNILVASGNPETVSVLAKQVLGENPATPIETASTWGEIMDKATSRVYSLVVLDIPPAPDLDPLRIYDLLHLAVKRGFHVAMIAPSSPPRESPGRASPAMAGPIALVPFPQG
jgi:hypothetical protein